MTFAHTFSANCSVSLLTPAAGYEFCVRTANDISASLTLAALGTGLYYDEPNRSGWGTVTTGTLATSTATKANQICVVEYDSTHYAVHSYTGDWAAN